MIWRLLTAFVLFASVAGHTQQTSAALDSLMGKLNRVKTNRERVETLGDISRLYMNENLVKADSVGEKMMEEAELSRDRQLMVEALLVNGERYSYFASRKENFEKAVGFYNKALELSRQNKLDREIARSFLALSAIYRSVPDADRAFNYCNQAFSYIATIESDSLKILGHLEFGAVYRLKREKLLSLRNYLSGLRIAEQMKNTGLKKSCYDALTNFYAGMEDYDKAIDYAVRALKLLEEMKNQQSAYQKCISLNTIGNLYSLKKNYQMATYFFQHSVRQADSLRYEPLKIPAYLGILNNYLYSNRPAEALDYLNKSTEVKAFAEKFGFGQQIDYAYGYIYTDLGKFDSATYYYTKAASFYEKNSNEASKYVYYYQLGKMYKLSGNDRKAIDFFLKAKNIADKVADPRRIQEAAKELDSVYLNTGDYRQSKIYGDMYYQYKDSLEKLGKEKDLLQIEAADEQIRQERIAKEKEEAKLKRQRIQIMAITIGIAALFIILVMLGLFRVSATTIKMLGFFVFLMLFEFIFLVFKKNIYGITKGELWKDLLFMIALAALLMPLHHWMEHKLIKFLTSHHMLKLRGIFSKRGEESL
jgi:tetratricopeptide (TPR) repeat protein